MRYKVTISVLFDAENETQAIAIADSVVEEIEQPSFHSKIMYRTGRNGDAEILSIEEVK